MTSIGLQTPASEYPLPATHKSVVTGAFGASKARPYTCLDLDVQVSCRIVESAKAHQSAQIHRCASTHMRWQRHPSMLVDVQVSQPPQPVTEVIHAEPVPAGPQQRCNQEPYPISWLARVPRGALVEIFLADLGLALGRGHFDGLEVLGSDEALPAYARLIGVAWYGGLSAAAEHAFGLGTLMERLPEFAAAEVIDGKPTSSWLLYPVLAHALRPVQEDGRCVCLHLLCWTAASSQCAGASHRSLV